MKQKVLLVDDGNESLLHALGNSFSAESYEVVLAENVEQAIEKSEAGEIELLLMKLDLRSGEGWEAILEITEENPFLPIIVVTSQPGLRTFAKAAGARALVEEPIDVPVLLQTIRDLLAETSAIRTDRGEAPNLTDASPARRVTVFESPPRILYVDDNPQLRRFVELVLVRSGYDVDTAADGAEGWASLNRVSYNLLITDNNMPRLTGLELAGKARLAGMHFPIILTSGSPLQLDELDCAWLELAAFLPKPSTPGFLLDTVDQVLRSANHLRLCSHLPISALTKETHFIEFRASLRTRQCNRGEDVPQRQIRYGAVASQSDGGPGTPMNAYRTLTP